MPPAGRALSPLYTVLPFALYCAGGYEVATLYVRVAKRSLFVWHDTLPHLELFLEVGVAAQSSIERLKDVVAFCCGNFLFPHGLLCHCP